MLANLRDLKRRADNQNLVMFLYEHPIGENCEGQDCYLISGMKINTEKILQAHRIDWGIENLSHRVLDIAFNEDRSRVRKNNAPNNLAILRLMALNLLKQEKMCQRRHQGKRLQSAVGMSIFY